MTRGKPRNEFGSLTVELVLIAPVVFVMALTVIVFGRISETRQEVVEASRAAAEAAAVEPTAASAQSGAADTAVIGFSGSRTCVHAAVSTDVGHFYPGGYVSVTVTCQVSLSDVGVPGMPGTTTIRSSSIAPIDPYRSIR